MDVSCQSIAAMGEEDFCRLLLWNLDADSINQILRHTRSCDECVESIVERADKLTSANQELAEVVEARQFQLLEQLFPLLPANVRALMRKRQRCRLNRQILRQIREN